MTKNWIGAAAIIALMSLTSGRAVASPADTQSTAPGTASRNATRLIAAADAALQRGDAPKAVADAETAVRLSSNDADARALLGRAYLAAGRFTSAEAAFGDALALDPSLSRAAVLRAFAQIAIGQGDAAAVSLASGTGRLPESEVGLALALLGRRDEARERLLAATRAPGADARSRQNLAFAYALEGRWVDAAAVAGQDVPADQIAARMRRWAMIAQLRANPLMQVGALLGVLPVEDAGQPTVLALARPTRLPAVVESAPRTLAVAAPLVVAPSAAVMVPVAARAEVGPPRMRSTRNLPEDRPVAPQPAPAPVAPAIRLISAPAATKAIPALAMQPKTSRLGGRWAVQLGAYSSAWRTNAAWTRISARASVLNGYAPTGSDLRRRGATLYRLSVGGLATRAEAWQLCRRVQATGAACFVRRDLGDPPMRWALRNRDGDSA